MARQFKDGSQARIEKAALALARASVKLIRSRRLILSTKSRLSLRKGPRRMKV